MDAFSSLGFAMGMMGFIFGLMSFTQLGTVKNQLAKLEEQFQEVRAAGAKGKGDIDSGDNDPRSVVSP